MTIDLTTLDCFTKYQYDLQCKYTAVAVQYVKKLRYGKCTKTIFQDLIIVNSLLDIINGFDERDITLQLAKYNCITIVQLTDFINTTYAILNKYVKVY